jgi:hypothetical protein
MERADRVGVNNGNTLCSCEKAGASTIASFQEKRKNGQLMARG